MPKLQTLTLKFVENDSVDLARIQDCRDVTFWNPKAAGTSRTVNLIVNGVPIPMKEGDPMLSFGGYDDITRRDVVQITFVAGTGSVNNFIVFANKIIQD